MNILFDHQIFSLQNYGGISRHNSDLIDGLRRLKNAKVFLPILVSSNLYANNLSRHLFLNIGEWSSRQIFRYVYFIVNSLYTIIFLFFKKIDVYHATYGEDFFVPFISDKTKLFFTVHDCIYEKMGGREKWTKRIIDKKRKLIEKSDNIICVSNSVKRDILKFYKVNSKKVNVVYNSYSFDPKLVKITNKANFGFRYILYVGTRGFNKNFVNFVKAISIVLKKYPDVNVVCLGGGQPSVKESNLLKKYNLTKHFKFIKYISDRYAISVYKGAEFLVFPSFEEGFGMPMIEAFQCGCPVLASNIDVFREIGRESFIKFEPKSIASMSSAISSVLKNRNRMSTLVKKAYKKYVNYSPKKIVNMTNNLYIKSIK